ncbi:predicted protein [Naegleria gruberi]|uniref:protein-tyrosine-phosphatase n=1 Tax=Naegleria gruberi TaxID=5762 RepID=D2VSW8_NAEGR|nr:uncharacterized protein NAEGRDRAFT_51998 [Naegleria gruberi]EFC39975.1 predicted protein [Naegleria gruberi]|eukprot:XP_002672719.1 predicted protein [Naegleria gruberi strain NEG-M]
MNNNSIIQSDDVVMEKQLDNNNKNLRNEQQQQVIISPSDKDDCVVASSSSVSSDNNTTTIVIGKLEGTPCVNNSNNNSGNIVVDPNRLSPHTSSHLSIESSLEQNMDDYIADDDGNASNNNKTKKHHPVEFLTKRMKSFSNSDVLSFFKKPSPRSASPNNVHETNSSELLSSPSETEKISTTQLSKQENTMSISSSSVSYPTTTKLIPPKVKREKSTGNIYTSSSDDEITSTIQHQLQEKKRKSRQIPPLPLNETKIKRIALKTIYNMMVLQPSITDRVLPLILIDVRSSEKDYISKVSPTIGPQHNSHNSFSVSEMSSILSSQIESELIFDQMRPRSRSSATPPTQPIISPGTPLGTKVPLLNISSISPDQKFKGIMGSPKSGYNTPVASPLMSPRTSSLGISQHVQWSIHFYLPDHIIDHIPIDDLNKENVASIIHMIETSNTCIEKDLYKARFAWRKMSNVVVMAGSSRDEHRAKWLLRVLQLEGKSYNLYSLPHGLNFTHFEAKYPFSITSFDFVEFQLPTHIFKNIYLASYRVLTQERGIEVLIAKRLNIKRVLNCAKECKCVIPNKFLSEDSPTKPVQNSSQTLSRSESFSKTGISTSQTPKISYLHLLLDDFDPKHCYFTAEQMKESVLFINQSLKNNENILIHCQEGRSRSVTIICLYMMINIGWKLSYSLEFMRSQKPTISVHPTFLLELQAIEDYISDKIEKIKGNSTISSDSLDNMEGMIKVDSILTITDDPEPPERYLLKFTPLYEYSSTDDLSSVSTNASPRVSPRLISNRKLKKSSVDKLNVSLIFNRAKSATLSLPDSPLLLDPSTLYLDDSVLSTFLDEIGHNVIRPFIENLYSSNDQLQQLR